MTAGSLPMATATARSHTGTFNVMFAEGWRGNRPARGVLKKKQRDKKTVLFTVGCSRIGEYERGEAHSHAAYSASRKGGTKAKPTYQRVTTTPTPGHRPHPSQPPPPSLLSSTCPSWPGPVLHPIGAHGLRPPRAGVTLEDPVRPQGHPCPYNCLPAEGKGVPLCRA